MNRSLLKFFVGRTWPKEEVAKKEKSSSYFGYKIIMSFQRSHLNAFLMTFYLIFLQKLIYMFGFILLSSLLYITRETGHMESSVLLSLSASCIICIQA